MKAYFIFHIILTQQFCLLWSRMAFISPDLIDQGQVKFDKHPATMFCYSGLVHGRALGGHAAHRVSCAHDGLEAVYFICIFLVCFDLGMANSILFLHLSVISPPQRSLSNHTSYGVAPKRVTDTHQSSSLCHDTVLALSSLSVKILDGLATVAIGGRPFAKGQFNQCKCASQL